MGRIILAAAGSGSGKTVITCGLLRCMVNRGLKVNAYKCGPDYIDPMFHREIIGVPSKNLDTFFSDEEHISELLAEGENYELSIIEGVMGIYDGLGGCRLEGSAYDLAAKTGTGIILIFNAHGMGRTMVSQIKGILLDDTHKLIKGIIINQISESFYNTIAPIIENETGVKVLGHLCKLRGLNIESRHLGLMLPGEILDLQEQVDRVVEEIEKRVDIEETLEIVRQTGQLASSIASDKTNDCVSSLKEIRKVKLAVARDELFCFYYDENFKMLEKQGVELEFFSPLHDKKLPEDISGIYIGGGYPELGLKGLEANGSMRMSIKEAIAGNIPVIAECGGFMYLHEVIADEVGKKYQMVGSIKGECFNTGKLTRFGYVNITVKNVSIKGHEFHYFDSTAKLTDCLAIKPTTDKKWSFGYYRDGSYMGFPHLYFPSGKEFVIDFVEKMRQYKKD